jgi:membrane-bound inhibitor of C-type lysozyme
MPRKSHRLGLAALPLAMLMAAPLNVPAAAQNYVHYECHGGASFELALFEGTKAAFLQVDGKSLRLPQSISITGTRYRRDGITVWVNGERATLRRAGKRIECKAR